MKGIISTLVSLVVAFYVGRFLLDIELAHDLLAHFNECHAELNLKDRLNAPLDDAEVDMVFDQYGACVKQKSNFIDDIFGGGLAQKTVDAMREERKKKGPYDQRGSG